MVPKMEVITDNEKKRVLKAFGVNEEQLPKMSVRDPSVQAIKADVGDIVAIHREDSTGKYTAYKLVVSGSWK